ncbi:uncharacterized protein A4U43_C01F21750 [Asparagus officinalis]|uniref:Enhancer of polycomb-like protein n=2 Tax=Asparagus officinalis TaxID=4686 RepID=A0A5P1FUU3_ASPOF|nr:uncharacterized protein A4U43_C01F21750 [Asparagus officinalis]
MQMPFTSIGINLSGLHGKGGKILFLLYRFLEIKSSKRTYLEDELKRHCMTMREVQVLECTSSTFKKLCNGRCHMLCTSTYKNSVSLENLPERSNSDILHQIIPNKRFYLKMNPTICYIGDNIRQLPSVSPSFVTAPSFILSLHIKSLIQNNKASISSLKHNSRSYQESPDSCDKLTVNGCSPSEDPSEQVSDITMENLGSSLGQVIASSRKPSIHHLKVDTDALSVSNEGDSTRSSDNSLRNEVDLSRNFVDQRDMELNGSEETVARTERLPSHTGLWQDADKSSSSFPEGYSSPDKSEGGCNSSMNDINVHAQSVGQIEEQPIDKGTLAEESALDLAWERNGYSIHSNPTAPRSVRHCNGRSLVSSKYGQLWQEDFSMNGFVHGSKKPRTHVSYSLPFGGYDLGWKRRSQQRKPRPLKKITTDNAKRLSGASANSTRCHRPLACNANVLVTVGDKGWRESGAQVVLESDDHKDCRILVKFSGVTKYVYKAQHILQPGITNRHTHAMMWKGGKDWALEFTDRSQWSLFKEIHEECYNRNMRAAYVKNIPIPGVRLIADDDCDNLVGVPFVRSSLKYHRQVGTEVDMALDPAHVLYDMDSDDEEWVLKMRNSVDMKEDDISEMSDDMFERVMDIFEKFAYAEECDEFSNDEIEEFMDDVGPLNIVKTIYGYWHEKRMKKGMALIRHFQPALWLRYQQQLKEWESAMSKVHSLPDVSREKQCRIKKPPMFAFCLRPRGLEVPHKLLKQRSHKKLISTSSYNAFGREQDGFYSSGRRDDRAFISIPNYESSDSYHSNEGSERIQYPELHRSNSKKRGSFSSPRDSHIMPFPQNKKLKKNGIDQWGSSGIYEPANMSQIQRDGLRRHRADIDEFKLRDASNAAQHALNMAKMKREKVQWLMHKADLAVHKATVALMIAEVMKESKEQAEEEEDNEEEELSDEDDI